MSAQSKDSSDTRCSNFAIKNIRAKRKKFAKTSVSVHMGPRSNLFSKRNGEKYRDTVPLSRTCGSQNNKYGSKTLNHYFIQKCNNYLEAKIYIYYIYCIYVYIYIYIYIFTSMRTNMRSPATRRLTTVVTPCLQIYVYKL